MTDRKLDRDRGLQHSTFADALSKAKYGEVENVSVNPHNACRLAQQR